MKSERDLPLSNFKRIFCRCEVFQIVNKNRSSFRRLSMCFLDRDFTILGELRQGLLATGDPPTT
jgi:hypothetical protein